MALLVWALALANYLPNVVLQSTRAFVIGALVLSISVLASPPQAGRQSALGNANDVALFLAMALVLSIHLLSLQHGATALMYLTPIPILVLGIVATGSRTAVFAGLAGVSYVYISHWARRRRGRSALLVLFVLTPAALAIGTGSAATFERLVASGATMGVTYLSGRQEIWMAAIQQGFDGFGVGAGAAPAVLESVFGSRVVMHSIYLGFAFELGLLGLILLATLIGLSLRRCKGSPFGAGALGIWIVVLVSGLSLSLELRRAFWLAVALAWAVAMTGDGPALNRRDGAGKTVAMTSIAPSTRRSAVH
jgi:O-antigen ligase